MLKKIFCILIFSFVQFLSMAQENFTAVFEPEVSFWYKVSPNYTHSFDIENRNFFYYDGRYNYQVKHLEISHSSILSLNERQAIELGLQYRFNENFIASEENEFRLFQAFQWSNNYETMSISHQFQNEQRIYASTTKFRGRYELALTFPFKDNSKSLQYFKSETEALFEVAKTQKPEYEQRLSGLLGWKLSKTINFETGLQYRLGDYTQDLSHELFVVFATEIRL